MFVESKATKLRRSKHSHMRSLKNISDKAIKSNLIKRLDKATEAEIKDGMKWYKEAQEHARFLSDTFNVSRKVAAGVISALSPNNKWERNKIDAFNLLQAVTEGKSPDDIKVCTYNANKIKAFAIAKGDAEILERSPKTFSFAMNVGELSAEHVTVDKWHMRACLTRSKKRVKTQEAPTSAQYKRVEKLTAQIAKARGLKGFELQAIVWVQIKNEWEG